MGRAIARRFAKEGARVTLADIDETAGPAAIPLGRVGEAEEVAGLALYLASDESRFLTGAAASLRAERLGRGATICPIIFAHQSGNFERSAPGVCTFFIRISAATRRFARELGKGPRGYVIAITDTVFRAEQDWYIRDEDSRDWIADRFEEFRFV